MIFTNGYGRYCCFHDNVLMATAKTYKLKKGQIEPVYIVDLNRQSIYHNKSGIPKHIQNRFKEYIESPFFEIDVLKFKERQKW